MNERKVYCLKCCYCVHVLLEISFLPTIKLEKSAGRYFILVDIYRVNFKSNLRLNDCIENICEHYDHIDARGRLCLRFDYVNYSN